MVQGEPREGVELAQRQNNVARDAVLSLNQLVVQLKRLSGSCGAHLKLFARGALHQMEMNAASVFASPREVV